MITSRFTADEYSAVVRGLGLLASRSQSRESALAGSRLVAEVSRYLPEGKDGYDLLLDARRYDAGLQHAAGTYDPEHFGDDDELAREVEQDRAALAAIDELIDILGGAPDDFFAGRELSESADFEGGDEPEFEVTPEGLEAVGKYEDQHSDVANNQHRSYSGSFGGEGSGHATAAHGGDSRRDAWDSASAIKAGFNGA